MGLIAREVEKAGIATLCMSSAWDITFAVRPPRAVFLNFPLNHQTGKANDPALQRRILLDAFKAFETLWVPGQILSLPYMWDPNDATWEEKDFGPNFNLYGVGKAIQEGYSERPLSRARDGLSPDSFPSVAQQQQRNNVQFLCPPHGGSLPSEGEKLRDLRESFLRFESMRFWLEQAEAELKVSE